MARAWLAIVRIQYGGVVVAGVLARRDAHAVASSHRTVADPAWPRREGISPEAHVTAGPQIERGTWPG
jgi:hypothetical protein